MKDFNIGYSDKNKKGRFLILREGFLLLIREAFIFNGNIKGHSPRSANSLYLNGSLGWTRTNNPAINSRMLHH